MNPYDWIIPVSALEDERLETPVLESNKEQFRILILNPRSSKTIPLTFRMDLLTRIQGLRQIFATLTIVSPKGPECDYVFSIGGTFSANNVMFVKKTDINILFLEDHELVVKGKIRINVSIRFVNQAFDGISRISELVDPASVVRKILSPHITAKVCPATDPEIAFVCQAATEIMMRQPCLLHLGTPVIVVGDLHGQYHDLIRIFRKYGFPNIANYLFLGDYVDRGNDSLDVITLLLAFKVLYPDNIFLLRGNHECSSVTATYGFKEECSKKEREYSNFLPVFEALPIAAIVGNKIFCVHGGIAPSIESLDEIKDFHRPQEVPSIGNIHELLWSDPIISINGFGKNMRGSCVTFGEQAAKSFMSRFGFDMIVRGHETVEHGYMFPFGESTNVLTIFSATEYAKGHNLGAALIIDNGLNYYIDTYKGFTEDEVRRLDKTDFNPELGIL